jgi:pimeloyl-ACP methyl ester carboxylesterase
MLNLKSGPFDTLYYAGTGTPKGIIVLGSGDGGWSYWEDNTARHLAGKDYVVGSWDCRKFADTRKFDQAKLEEGYLAVVNAVKKRSHAGDVPIWYGGWSTGAEQSAAAAATKKRPARLVGLLLAAPGERGRYGITTSDLLGQKPQGPDTFSMAELAPKLKGLRVAQFVADLDPLDDTKWLKALEPTEFKIFRMKNMLHDMGGAGPKFQAAVDEAMIWTLVKNN